MINELGPNDWRFKAIKQAFESGREQEVGQVCCNNPNAHWNQVEQALLDAGYGDMVDFSDDLGLEPTQEDKALYESYRMQKLAGLLKESSEPGFDYLMDLVDDIIDPTSIENQYMQDAINDALASGAIDTERLSVEPQYASEVIDQIAHQIGISLNEKEGDEMDYFEYLDETPQEVQDIIEKYADDMNLGYEKCQQLIDELEQVGWTCDYGLDGVPYDLKPLDNSQQLNENLSPLDFSIGDEVWVQSANTYGTVVDTSVENEEGEENDLIVVELPNKEQMTVSTSEVEKMEDSGESDGDHYGDDEDDASYYARRGWQAKMDEMQVDFKSKVPASKKQVDVNDFEQEHYGNLDNYIRKLVSQELQKAKSGKVIPFKPKH